MENRFFIAPYDESSGQQNNVKPWLIPDNAFEVLNNAYVFRGRVRKRFGSRYFANSNSSLSSRLRILLAPAGLIITTPINIEVGQAFSIGNDIFTVVDVTPPYPKSLLSTSAVTATLTAINQITFSAIAASVYFYPSLPVMGLLTYENSATNDEATLAFDTKFSYQYDNLTVGWERIIGAAAEWYGSTSDFFWGVTWSGVLASERIFFVTNFNQLEPNFMRYFNGAVWASLNPAITAAAGNTLQSARILTVFKDRLIALNTWEGGVGPLNYVNRARYCQIGDPLDATAWRQDIAGKGNAIDAPTKEAIITVEFIKDRLIVYFERSTWELAYTGNQIYPFSWQQINTELGAESTFSVIPFDKLAIGVGNVGIHACNGSNVDRIDQKIPNTIFDIKNDNAGAQRVYGIRDYFSEMLYWAFPNNSAITFPNKIFVYNYPTKTWSFNDDSITCFGYFQPSNSILWNSTTVYWSSDVIWNSGSVSSKFQQVVAGNQQGYTFICDTNINTNELILQINNITLSGVQTSLQVIDHNLAQDEYIYIDNAVWNPAGNYLNTQIFQVLTVTDKDNFTIGPNASFTGVYQGGGLISRVSQINIKTKQYNFYAQIGRNSFVNKVDFLVDRTTNGQIDVNYYVSTSSDNLLLNSANTGSLLGTGTLDTFPYPLIPLEATSTRLWHPVYFQAEGEVIQFELTMNSLQMLNPLIRQAGFQLHAMCIYSNPSSFRFQ
jgi:hypothetical protein